MRTFRFLAYLLICCSLYPNAGAYRGVNGKKAYMAKTAAALQSHLNEAEVRLINDTVKVLFPKNLMFDNGQAQVRMDFMPSLERFSRVLNAHRNTEILIIGHTDGVGKFASNQDLSMRRADSVERVLKLYGVSAGRLNAWGLGSEMPLSHNKTEAGRSLNRRVEFIILYNYAEQDQQQN